MTEKCIFDGLICILFWADRVERPCSLIDHIYVNDAMKDQGVSTEIDTAYYSDHDIISLNILKQ